MENEFENFYNTESYGKNDFKNDQVQYDVHHNPVGDQYDLGKDGAFKGYSVLIGVFYLKEGLPTDISNLSVPALQKKGMKVTVATSEKQFSSLISEHTVLWIISGSAFVDQSYSQQQFKNGM